MKLKVIRAEKLETQWSLSKETGIHQSKLSLIEKGHVVPTDEEKSKIADALKVNVKEIDWDIDSGGKNGL